MFKKKITTNTIISYSIYLGIMLFMALTPQIGFINISGIKVTTLLIPIVIATIHLGFWGAIFTSSIFGFFSFILGMTLYPSLIFSIGLDNNVCLWFINSFITRFAMGIIVGCSYILINKIFNAFPSDSKYSGKNIFIKPLFWKMLIISIIAQLTNSLLFIGTYIILCHKSIDVVLVLISINSLIEWIIVIIIPLSFSPLAHHLIKINRNEEKW